MNDDALGTTLRERLWDRLRRLAGSTRFDASRPDRDSVKRAAGHARAKLYNKLEEIDRLEAELLKIWNKSGGRA